MTTQLNICWCKKNIIETNLDVKLNNNKWGLIRRKHDDIRSEIDLVCYDIEITLQRHRFTDSNYKVTLFSKWQRK